MALYNVGDRVIVKENLGTIDNNYRYGYGSGMERFCGQTVTISAVDHDFEDENCVIYSLVEDDEHWKWGSDDFVGLADNSTPQQTISKKADLKTAWGQYCDTDKLVDDVMALLTKYGHRNSEYGVCKMLNEYFTNKKDLIELFQKSEHYIGDMRMMIDIELERENSARDIRDFCDEFPISVNAKGLLLKYKDENGKKFEDYLRTGVKSITAKDLMKPESVAPLKKATEQQNTFDSDGATKASHDVYRGFCSAIDNFKGINVSTISHGNAERMNEKYKVREGMKTSRAFNRVCTFYGVDKAKKYNKLFAQYADMVNGLKRKLKFFISVNPIDYLTMSFGVNWASCHTIDKENRRRMPSSYSGMYCGGTMSYMLDGTSIITFVHDHMPTNWEDGKIYRCMFHYGNDILVQGRVYPQGNDGNTDLYKVFRNYMQDELSPLIGLTDTIWRKKDSGRVSSNVQSYGVHYRDYTSYSSCNVSYPRERSDSSDNVINIGKAGICPHCGRPITESGNISHSSCRVPLADTAWITATTTTISF